MRSFKHIIFFGLILSCSLISAANAQSKLSKENKSGGFSADQLHDMYQLGVIVGSDDGGVTQGHFGGTTDCVNAAGSTITVTTCSGCNQCRDKVSCQGCCDNNCKNSQGIAACKGRCPTQSE